eukprot:10061421-Ditylum_brightwellii.AAC.1
MTHFRKNNTWVYVNEYDTKYVGSPGFLTEIHPKLINLPTLKFDVEAGLKDVNCNEEKVVSKWEKKNNIEDELYNMIPNFKLFTQYKSFGDRQQVSAPVIMIQSAAEDA